MSPAFASVLMEVWHGGANRLYDAVMQNGIASAGEWIPDVVKGDLDSLRPEVMQYYRSKGTNIVKDPCQDTNDLGRPTLNSLDAGPSRFVNALALFFITFSLSFDPPIAIVSF